MIRFHKNGVTLVRDSHGVFHLLDPHATLRDVAGYIWSQEGLEEYRINPEEWEEEKKEVKIVQIKKEKEDRLRSVGEMAEDPYFSEP